VPSEAFTVVLADDSDETRELLSTALELNGRFKVVGQAGDGADAVELVRQNQPDLALLDLGMPRVGGLEALPALREASPHTRVIVVSGFPRGRLADVVAHQGALGYVEKGLSPRRMVDAVVAVAGILELVEEVLAQSTAQLDKDLRSGAAARRFMEETLDRWDCGEVLDVVNLLVSELVTNAVVHANSEASVAVLLTPAAIRIEVTDNGSGLPAVRDATDEDTTGRGMALVEALASDWGILPRAEGKTVWFEVPRPDDAARVPSG
jgi:DNA-binding NarL/FixJ family response regulator